MQTVATTPASGHGAGNDGDAVYNSYLARFSDRAAAILASGTPLFTTDAEDLFAVYLSAFPNETQRQYHSCSACRTFINRFGGLVTIAPDGATQTVLWEDKDAPEFYRPSVQAMAHAVRRAKVTGVFLSSDKMWGAPTTGMWTHLSVKPPREWLYKGRVLTAGQAMAEKRKDFAIINRALAEFKLDQIEQALTLLDTDALFRAEKVRGPVQWLKELYVARDNAPKGRRTNVTWLAVATAAPGFCHPRSSMAGTLLEDIATGMDFDEVSRRFKAKMHPLQYQRPQERPGAQNIARGEKVIEALGAQRSLLRRFARLEEVEALWRPLALAPPEPAKEASVFGHLVAKGEAPSAPINAPAVTMTWDKFYKTVLPTAEAIEFYAPSARDNYTALVTAVDPEAPPILQWDLLEKRNPVSWYVWHGGSAPEQFQLASNSWHRVSAIALKPCFWYEPAKFKHHGNGVVVLLESARETRLKDTGNALFPEILKSDFHAIRATIEAYSKSTALSEPEQGTACGLMLDGRTTWNALLKIRGNGRTVQYRLDRWD